MDSRKLLEAFQKYYNERTVNQLYDDFIADGEVDEFLRSLPPQGSSVSERAVEERAIAFGNFLKDRYRVIDNPNDEADEACLWQNKEGDIFPTHEAYFQFQQQQSK